jgi:hypothetical protein
MVFLTLAVKEWETQDFASIDWDVAVVEGEARCEIEYGDNEHKSNLNSEE